MQYQNWKFMPWPPPKLKVKNFLPPAWPPMCIIKSSILMPKPPAPSNGFPCCSELNCRFTWIIISSLVVDTPPLWILEQLIRIDHHGEFLLGTGVFASVWM
jgi:hypothetical protein